jgi:hypothetical protein
VSIKLHSFGGSTYVVTDGETGEELGVVGKNPTPRLTGWPWTYSLTIGDWHGPTNGALKSRKVAVEKLIAEREKLI